MSSGLAADYAPAQENFFKPVPGFVAPSPGEHPRLLFRKGDLAILRERAKTADGNMLIERTKFLLGGADKVREGKDFTMFDAAAFGFLYQITGDKKYTALAKGSQEHFWTQGTTDRDDRYSLTPPNEPMRAGPSLYAVALAYDLCYDGWDAEYRQEQAQKIFTWKGRCKKRGGEISTESMALHADSPNPVSNHYGLQVGGIGLTLLALGQDPELTDPQRTRVKELYETGVFKQARKVLTEDFGQTGYFAEHGGPGVIATTWTMTPWLKAERVCAGRDWLSDPKWPNPEWMSLHFVMETIVHDNTPMYTNPCAGRGGYGGDVLEQNGGHHAGYFSQGFGAIQESRKPAMLWVYNTFVEPYEKQQYKDAFPSPETKSFDTFNYPHRPLYAFLDWPFDVKPENPERTIPRAVGDMHYGQFIFRNRWKDKDDTIVCITFGARTSDKDPRRSMVWGLSQQLTFGSVAPVTKGTGKIGQAVIDYWQPAEDGSGVVSAGGTSIGVDYSLASGADAVIVMVGKGADGKLGGKPDATKTKKQTIEAGGTTFQILTLSATGKHPDAIASGNKVTLGNQAISFDGKNIVFAKIVGAPKLTQ